MTDAMVKIGLEIIEKEKEAGWKNGEHADDPFFFQDALESQTHILRRLAAFTPGEGLSYTKMPGHCKFLRAGRLLVPSLLDVWHWCNRFPRRLYEPEI